MIIVLVHGWSVSHTNTYGELARRLEADSASGALPALTVRDVYLGKYVSFSDEVRLEDISRAFEAAVQRELGADLARGERLAVITHSTGGPVLRDWWYRYYRTQNRPCPMQHLIMLAPANFGSALAQLGKSRISELAASIKDGVDPGVGVLDWLEHGSPEAWALNKAWIHEADPAAAADPLYQFVLTGQSIDRKLYDHVNAYTGEAGSDGVVRVAAANLNASYLKLTQARANGATTKDTVLALEAETAVASDHTAFALIAGRAHSNEDKGIIRSIGLSGRHPTYSAIVKCLRVSSPGAYRTLARSFDAANKTLRARERLELQGRGPFKRRYFHDAHSLIIARIRDRAGYAPERLDFKLTGRRSDPDALPNGMIVDSQKNQRDPFTLTLYLNADKALGTEAVLDRKGDVVREALPGLTSVGLTVLPRPRDRYVGFALAQLRARAAQLPVLIRPDQTLLLDIELDRLVRSGTFELTPSLAQAPFKNQPKGRPVP